MYQFYVISPFRTQRAWIPCTLFVMIDIEPDGCSANLMSDSEIDCRVDYLQKYWATTRAERDQLEQVRIEAKQELRALRTLPPEDLFESAYLEKMGMPDT